MKSLFGRDRDDEKPTAVAARGNATPVLGEGHQRFVEAIGKRAGLSDPEAAEEATDMVLGRVADYLEDQEGDWRLGLLGRREGRSRFIGINIQKDDR